MCEGGHKMADAAELADDALEAVGTSGAGQFAKSGRPRNLRKKQADDEEEDMTQVRSAIAAAKLKESSTRAGLSGGGEAMCALK